MNIPIVYLVRHAERQAIPAGEFGNDANLTTRGVEHCQQLRRLLGDRLKKIYTSPVKRCVQTAEYLASNANKNDIQQSTLLGDPGIFISDRHQAHQYFLQYPPITLVQHLLSQQENPPGFCTSTSETTFDLIRYVVGQTIHSGIYVFITHDSILSVVLGIMFEAFTVKELWPDYLEGIFFWQQHGYLHTAYRQLHKQLVWTSSC